MVRAASNDSFLTNSSTSLSSPVRPVSKSKIYEDSSPLKSKNVTHLKNTISSKGVVLKFSKNDPTTVFIKSFEQVKNPEKLERAVAKGNVAQFEEIDGQNVVKVTRDFKTRLKAMGITQFAVKNANGELIVPPAKFKTLSDQELKNLYTAAKAQIVFLQTMKAAEKEEKIDDDPMLKIAESILKQTGLELAIRKGSKQEISAALKLIFGSLYDTGEKAARAYKALEEVRQKQKEREEEIKNLELKREIVQVDILKTEIKFGDLRQSTVRETNENAYEKPPVSWSHMNPQGNSPENNNSQNEDGYLNGLNDRF